MINKEKSDHFETIFNRLFMSKLVYRMIFDQFGTFSTFGLFFINRTDHQEWRPKSSRIILKSLSTDFSCKRWLTLKCQIIVHVRLFFLEFLPSCTMLIWLCTIINFSKKYGVGPLPSLYFDAEIAKILALILPFLAVNGKLLVFLPLPISTIPAYLSVKLVFGGSASRF